MAISVDWVTRIISIPKADLSLVQASPEIRELDLDVFRLELKDVEDSEEGVTYPDTHIHNTEVTLSGVTYSRFIEIVNNYTVTFEDGQYAVNAVGANSNIADVMNVNQVSLRTFNSAGLQTVVQGSGVLPGDKTDIAGLVWDQLATNHTVNGSFGLLNQRIAGLVQENQKIYNTVHVNGLLTSANVKVYPSQTDLNADTNAIATYLITATYNGDNTLNEYKVELLP